MIGFRISAPETVGDVLSELSEDPDSTALYAGGTELLLAMKQGLITPQKLIDIKRVREFGPITVSDGGDALQISAATTHMEVLRSRVAAENLPVLPSVIRHVGNSRVRSAGTLIGNLCFAEPHSDVSTLTTLLDGRLRIAGKDNRWIPIEDFIVEAYETALGPDELVTSLQLPIPRQGTFFGYRRFKGMERPMVTAAVALTIVDRSIVQARVCIGAAAGKPFRSAGVEQLLTGVALDSLPDVLTDAACTIAAEIDAVGDYEASEQYRRHLSAELFLRAVSDATDDYARAA